LLVVGGGVWRAEAVEGLDDCFGAFGGGCGRDVDQFVAVGPVAVAVDLLEDEGVLVADAAGRGGLAEAEVSDEEHVALVDGVAADPVEFVEQQRARVAAEVRAQRVGADRGAVVELDGVPGARARV